MFVLSNLLEAIATILNLLLSAYLFIIIGRALVSWFSPDPYNPIVRFLYQTTEPVLGPIRRKLRLAPGGIDLSPLLLIFTIIFLQKFLIRSLLDLAFHLR
ncbi:MAG: YggT family protein [Deltaproteobacteria bacterium]|nr:YggT family protein [Deltaproteobacteria bacterium]